MMIKLQTISYKIKTHFNNNKYKKKMNKKMKHINQTKTT